jgi:hypothetical protein
MDTTSVAYTLCRIEDDASLTPVSQHGDFLTGIAPPATPSRLRTPISRTPSTLAIPRTGRPRAWHPSARAGSAIASGPRGVAVSVPASRIA